MAECSYSIIGVSQKFHRVAASFCCSLLEPTCDQDERDPKGLVFKALRNTFVRAPNSSDNVGSVVRLGINSRTWTEPCPFTSWPSVSVLTWADDTLMATTSSSNKWAGISLHCKVHGLVPPSYAACGKDGLPSEDDQKAPRNFLGQSTLLLLRRSS